MFLTEWFGNGYVGNAAPKAFYVRPGVALDERGALILRSIWHDMK